MHPLPREGQFYFNKNIIINIIIIIIIISMQCIYSNKSS